MATRRARGFAQATRERPSLTATARADYRSGEVLGLTASAELEARRVKCPRCQTENPPQAKFCLECAAPLPRPCANCGTQLPASAKFCPECAHPVPRPAAAEPRFVAPDTYTPKHLAEKILTSKSALEGERKQVTVLFADLKGSMELLADRDPEEARGILDPVLERMMEAVHRYEGTVNQVMGDGIMALFGAPVAHEDHAVRACYAALRMQDAVKRYAEEVQRTAGVPIQIRVGLNSGEVVVRSIGSDLHMDYTAVGQTTHLAARMEQLARPATILMTADTLRLAEGAVDVTALGPTPIKGLPEPAEVYELLGTGSLRTLLQAMASRQLTPLVGRSHELAEVHRARQEARAGHGQVVALVGEPGVGKSRLLFELTRSSQVDGWLVLEAGAHSYGTATSYLSVVDLLKAYFKVHDHDDHDEVRSKITGGLRGLDPTLTSLPVSPFLALLDVPVGDAGWTALDSQERRRGTLDAITRMILRESQVQPVVVVLDNLHWIDSETQALLDVLVERLPGARIVLVVTYRPEYRHPWGGKTYYRQIRVDPLPPDGGWELLRSLLGDDESLDSLRQLLLDRTEGNPFFLEESVRTLVEARALTGIPGMYRRTREVMTLKIPPTVQAVLAARIDRLPSQEKQILQAAAVIGQHVPRALLSTVADEPEDVVDHALAHLQAAELLYQTKLVPDLEYTFKHALTHQVAHGSLLQDRRRTLHARVVAAIESRYADRLGEHIEQLARHAWDGGLWNAAVAYSRDAGVKAHGRSAFREAVFWFERALEALGQVQESRESHEAAIDLHLAARNALVPLGEQARILDHLTQAERLATALGDRRRLCQILSPKTQYWRFSGEPSLGIETGERALQIATSLDDRSLHVAANFYLALVYQAHGDVRSAVAAYRRYADFFEGELVRERFGMAGFPAVLYPTFLGDSLAELGEFAEALQRTGSAVSVAERLGQAYSLCAAYAWLGAVHLRKGDNAAAVPVLERALEISRSGGVGAILPVIASFLGAAYTATERPTEAVALLRGSLTTGRNADRSLAATWLAEAYLKLRRVDEALAAARQGIDLATRHGERGHGVRARRALGDVLADPAIDALDSARECYGEALVQAEELGLRPLVAHCHLGLGKLYRRTAQREQAQEHLTTATAMYREMDMTYWLEKAQTELTEFE
jgi:class 3 adenylate cyclase/tetratricopeptide (TPR) repeat protein